MPPTDETSTPSVATLASWLETEHPRLFLYFLTVLGLNEHLARYLSESPIRGENPITLDIHRLIAQRYPRLDTHGAIDLLLALQKHLYETHAIQQHLEYTPPR